MENKKIDKQIFLIEVKDVTGSYYYFKTTAIDETYAISTLESIFCNTYSSNFNDTFMKVYTDAKCDHKHLYYIRRSALIGFGLIGTVTN